jgi:hypothetical protein
VVKSDYILPVIAIVIALASFALSFYNVFRDRPRLKVTSRYIAAWEYGPEQISIALINMGRRPVIIRLVGGTTEKGESGGTYVEHDKGGLRLGEHERHEQSLSQGDTMLIDPEGSDIRFKVMWVEDSLGNRHAIPNSGEYIKRLWTTNST